MDMFLLCLPPTLYLKVYFLESNEKVGVSLTPKLHAVLQHLEEFVMINGFNTVSADAQANENINEKVNFQ